MGVVHYAPPPDVWPTDGSVAVSFNCDDGSFVDAKMPPMSAVPGTLTRGRRGVLTWAPARAFVRFVGEDGGVVLPPDHTGPWAAPAPVAPAAPPARPARLFDDLSCAGAFHGVRTDPSSVRRELWFACDGQPSARFDFPTDTSTPTGLPPDGTLATLKFTRYYANANRAELNVWTELVAGGARWKPKTLLEALYDEEEGR